MRLLPLTLVLAAPLAMAQDYPAKPIRLVTQFAPGSGGDALARVVASHAAPLLGQPVIVENRAGAGGALAAEFVARATPDGYTLLAATQNTQVMRVFLVKKSSFDPVRDFTPITRLGESTHLLLAGPSAPASTLRELLDYARKNPGKLAYGTAGVGSIHHLAGEQLRMLSSVDIVHVPYKATAQALIDVVSGVLPVSFDIAASAMPQVKAGKVRVAAVMGDTRAASLPNVATIAEVVPGFQAPPSWSGLFGPAGLPQPIVRRLNGDVVKGLSTREAQAKVHDIGFEVRTNTPEAFAKMIRSQVELVGRIVKAAKIEPAE